MSKFGIVKGGSDLAVGEYAHITAINFQFGINVSKMKCIFSLKSGGIHVATMPLDMHGRMVSEVRRYARELDLSLKKVIWC
jgi:hypothetical protein